MTNRANITEFSAACLTDDDLYQFIAGSAHQTKEALARVHAHLSTCEACRQSLAGLLDLLQPGDDGRDNAQFTPPSQDEIYQTLAVIRAVSRKERQRKVMSGAAFRWPLAAAAAIGFFALSAWLLMHFYELRRSNGFYDQARLILEKDYPGAGPSNLRLKLPFNPVSAVRSANETRSLEKAENLLFQALAVREEMPDAHMGLASIYLGKSDFSGARAEFDKALEYRKDNPDALIGRGVAQHEEALQSPDPLQRIALLKNALNDFGAALKLNPDSAEARYNLVWSLFESGRHPEALKEIDRYLASDASSSWAQALKGLKLRIEANRTSAVNEKIDEAARMRDGAALAALARHAPYQMPAAIWQTMRKSLDIEGAAARQRPNSQDLLWAAVTMEKAYADISGDRSFRQFIDFHIGLSPPERVKKKALDREFQQLVKRYVNREFDVVLHRTLSLEPQYEIIKDSWQLFNLHHLRGHSLYLKADFAASEAELVQMHRVADRLDAPALVAKALAMLALVHAAQGDYDAGIDCATKIRQLGAAYGLAPWQMYGATALAYSYRLTGQYSESLRAYADGLTAAYRLLDGAKIVEILSGVGMVSDRMGRTQAARDSYRIALENHDRFLRGQGQDPGALAIRPNLLLREGELAERTGAHEEAESILREALRSVGGMRELEGRIRGGLAGVYLNSGRIQDAKKEVHSVERIGASGSYPDLKWQSAFLRGRLLEKTGRRHEALRSIQRSIELVEAMRRSVTPTDIRQSFYMDRFDPHRKMVSLLFEEGDIRGTLDAIDRAKSTTLREGLDLRRISADPPRSSAFSSADASYPILEYFFTNDDLLILFSTAERTTSLAGRISRRELTAQISDFLDSIQRRDAARFRVLSRRLYEKLIAPVERHAFERSYESMVVLPDGPLHLLPFSGLQDEQGRFLIEKTALSYAPSRTLFEHCLRTGRRRGTAIQKAALIDGSAPLPSAREELFHLSGLYGSGAVILGPRDIMESRKIVSAAHLIHYSGHARDVQGRPVLELQRSPKAVYLDARAIGAWDLSKSCLVNLAGCSTATGTFSEGESPWGLIPAFLNAGAPAVVASLLPVDDVSTRNMSRTFYDLLQKGYPKARAMQKAQLALLERSRTPSATGAEFWIPYILVGNPK